MTEGRLLQEKLVVAVQVDYPHASEVLVSFPDKWELIRKLKRGEGPPHAEAARTIYVAAWPPSEERIKEPDHFVGLSPEINLGLTSYRLYKFFVAWRQPHITIAWDIEADQGQVVGGGPLTIQLNPIGQAQAWYGQEHVVLWECLLHRLERKEGWQELLADIWKAVEASMGVGKVYTMPRDPIFETAWYREFLSHLSYGPDPESERWWSKSLEVESNGRDR